VAPVIELERAASAVLGDWERDALCKEYPSRWWFPELGETLDRARDVCGRCKVSAECLAHAMTNREQHGVWAGTSERERRQTWAEERSTSARRPYRERMERGA